MFKNSRRGFSLIELVAVITLVGLIAAVTMYRMNGTDKDQVKKTACSAMKGEIELQVRLWARSKGNWPATDLSDIGADTRYFQKGVAKCPFDNSSYTIDANTHMVVGHSH